MKFSKVNLKSIKIWEGGIKLKEEIMGGNNKIMIMSLIPKCVLGVILPESVQESMGPHFLVGPSIEESA